MHGILMILHDVNYCRYQYNI